jgi:hypothetical protein
MEENKGFKIVCQNCGCKDCTEEEDWDYDYDDNPYLLRRYFSCPDCGQTE